MQCMECMGFSEHCKVLGVSCFATFLYSTIHTAAQQTQQKSDTLCTKLIVNCTVLYCTVLQVANKLICLVCGVETSVESVPLSEIRETSLEAERLLCTSLDWVEGIRAVRKCQVLYNYQIILFASIKNTFLLF